MFADTFGCFSLNKLKVIRFVGSTTILVNFSATCRGSSSKFVATKELNIQSWSLVGFRVSP